MQVYKPYAMLCSMVWLGLTWVNLGWFALIWGTLNRQTHFWSTLQSTVSINFQRKIEFVKGVLSEPWSLLGTSHREPCETHGFRSMVLRNPRSGVSWNSSNSLSESYFLGNLDRLPKPLPERLIFIAREPFFGLDRISGFCSHPDPTKPEAR